MFVYTVFFQLDCELPNDGDLFVKKKKKKQLIQGHVLGQQHIFYFLIFYSAFSWRREWQPTPVFLPGKSHGQRTEEPGRLQFMGSQELD